MAGEIVTRPGMYELDEETYHGDPVPEGSLSCSGAKLLMPPGCPAVYDYARKNGRKPTRAMEIGTAAHREVLGTGWPVAVGEWEEWTTKAAKRFAEEARERGEVPLKPSEAEQIKQMAAAIASHPAASLLLNAGEVLAERSLFWVDPETGIWCRMRGDAVQLPGRVMVVDYKTARSADPDEFAKAAANYGYHWQDAHYRDGVTHVLGDADPAFMFVVQEKQPPFLVAVYELDPLDVLRGRERMAEARRKYARCVAAGEWPGYQPGEAMVTTIKLPRWGL